MHVGVLAIQGAYFKHQEVLNRLSVENDLIRNPGELDAIDALIIPGGESTTITKVLKSEGWLERVSRFAREHPVFGTCAGAILLASKVDSDKVAPWNVIDMSVSRNAYGRQVESFVGEINWSGNGQPEMLPAVFIRAPKILETGSGVEPIGSLDGDPVIVRQGHAMAATFHPELTQSTAVHRYFIEQVCRQVTVS
jgi:5'-phosphate synthase pdxT subunit